MKRDKENWITENIQSGTYVVMIRTPWATEMNDFSFSVYGPETTSIKLIKQEERPRNLLRNLLLSHAME